MELEQGEVICDKCEGRKVIERRIVNYIERPFCDKCHGFGKLDWIENVIGKERSEFVPGWIPPD